ncbi:hypothetical protein BACPLE_03130 [Phocaeicola plebeius DSM 17135]|uniref:Uncharacterized protein n=1 Tax=Phocaeicola plebeius (strain DSM 17135 / JCM 12973 / CCUG 54634 / M2) TaxID=484018 RepID=B5D2C7_PHOPM|nr:hypothetical protein BACPLE_03130 [Phocaeicola plebeius DSM 17135]
MAFLVMHFFYIFANNSYKIRRNEQVILLRILFNSIVCRRY